MAIEIKAPVFPESIADGVVATWHKKVGDAVKRDEVIAEIETDKVVLEIVAPENGALSRIIKVRGDTVLSNEVLAEFTAGDAPAVIDAPKEETPAPVPTKTEPLTPMAGPQTVVAIDQSPAVRKAIAENVIDINTVTGTGRGDRITKADVLQAVSAPAAPAVSNVPAAVTPSTSPASTAPAESLISEVAGQRIEKRVPMTRLRAKIAERLLAASQQTAMLTTFNEVNMKPIMDMRKTYGERFEKRHGTRLGFMSFFVKAATEALKRFPEVNASLDGTDIVYQGYYDVGVAVSSERGLVVPVLRDTDHMDMADIEKTIVNFGNKAKGGKLGIEDMTGGTFTITNGGVFGSLLSTPILNPPQTAILGMHKIQDRPMAVNGEVVILPMMYLALSYDHRLLDGKDAVSFLVTIKNLVEDPAMLLLDL